MKPKMSECRVFYVDVGNMSQVSVDEYVLEYKSRLKDNFDISEVIFVPVRDGATGWQYPA